MWTFSETQSEQTIVLAIDLSGSMAAGDVAPNRLAAAQKAAKTFITELPRTVQVAVVAYADSAELVQIPTLVRQNAIDAIDRFQLQGGTAIGDGILSALGALFPGRPLDLASVQQPPPAHVVAAAQPPVEPGSYPAGVVVLLTDGENTMGNDPLDAARLAASFGVRVHTVGFGTEHGAIVRTEGASEQVGLDESGLKEIAKITAGEYFRASSGEQLREVYKSLKGRLVTKKTETEATAVLAGFGALLLTLAAGLSVWRWGAVA
jgi:Ca-activated chloride channel family protein